MRYLREFKAHWQCIHPYLPQSVLNSATSRIPLKMPPCSHLQESQLFCCSGALGAVWKFSSSHMTSSLMPFRSLFKWCLLARHSLTFPNTKAGLHLSPQHLLSSSAIYCLHIYLFLSPANKNVSSMRPGIFFSLSSWSITPLVSTQKYFLRWMEEPAWSGSYWPQIGTFWVLK